MPERPLAGLSILVTRPREQGAVLAQSLCAAGADAIEFPVLDIVALAPTQATASAARIDGVIFVSVNAVHHGVERVRAFGDLPADAPVFAIGGATASALREAGYANVVSPQQKIDSEGLLALPQLHAIEGKHIILVRGKSEQGGRKLLETALAARGAQVTILECYERRIASPDSGLLNAITAMLRDGRLAVVMALSVETLDALMVLLAPVAAQLRDAWILVPHPRVAGAARERGFSRVLEVPMSAEALVPALVTLSDRVTAQKN